MNKGSRLLFIAIIIALAGSALGTCPVKADAISTTTTIKVFSGGPDETDAPDPSLVGESYRVSFSVVPASSGSPYGTVTVTDGNGASCSRTISSGSYTSGWGWWCDLASTNAGAKTLTVSFTPLDSSVFGGTASDTEPHTVNKAETTTVLLL